MAKKGQSASRHPRMCTEGEKPNQEVLPGVKITLMDSGMEICHPDEPDIKRDVSCLLKMGELAHPFATAVAQVLNGISAGNSRRTKYKDYRYGYFKFLEKCEKTPTKIADIDEAHVRSFVAWLTVVRSKRSGDLLTIGNRIHKLGCFTDALRKLSRIFPEINVSQLVPKNPWVGNADDRNKTVPLDYRTLRKLLSHVEAELEAHLALVEQSPDWKVGDPIRKQLRRSGLGTKMVIWGPTSRELFLAFEYLLIYTAFNEQPLRDLCLEDIEIEDFFGLSRISFRSSKARAGSAVRRVFVEDSNDKLSVHRVVKALIKWTAMIRSKAEPALQNRLFLFLGRSAGTSVHVGSFSRVDKSSDGIVRGRVAALSKEINESYVGSRAIRAAGAQILHSLTNGDLPLVALGLGHSSTTTTDNSYRSLAVRDNEEWKLAGVMHQRERYLDSNANVDPRNKRGLVELTSATPGWICIDSMSSPIEGQHHGSPCTAYPMCPSCPHSQPHPDQAYSLARTVQLYAKIQDAVSVQGMRAVQARYGGIIPFLAANLARISDPEIVTRASSMHLSPLPNLD